MGLLIVFSELMVHRKTTLVARKLALSQSAVSHALARLRDIFGEELFLRNGLGLQPTARALELAPEIEEILSLANKMIDVDGAFDPSSSDRLFRFAGMIYAATFLPPIFSEDFRQSAPHVRFSFALETPARTFDRLAEGELDIGFVTSEPPPAFDHVVMFEDDVVVIARAKHPKLKKGLDADTYLELDHLNGAPGAVLLGPADEVLALRRQKRRVLAGVSEFAAAAKIVSSSDVTMSMPGRLARQFAPIFKFDIFPMPFPLPKLKLRLVRHARSRNDSGVDWLAQRALLLTATPAAREP